MLRFFRICVLALSLTAGTDPAHASMSGPLVFREEVIRRLEALSFPWSLAAKLGVDRSLSQFEWWDDIKALQDMVNNPFPYVVLSLAGYDNNGFFSIDVSEYPSIEVRDAEVRSTLGQFAAYQQDNDTDVLLYYGPADLRVFRVSRYRPSGKTDAAN